MTDQTLLEHLPPPELRTEVVCAWEQRVDPSAAPHTFRSVPDGATEIVCELGSTPLVCGPRSRPADTRMAPGSVIVGLRLRPGAAAAALHVDVSELADLEVDGAALLGDRVARRLADAETPAALRAELQTAIASRTRPPDELALAAARLLARGHAVAGVARELAISERQLQRRCLRAAGIAPKPLAGALRYARFLALAAAPDEPLGSLARLAAESGYADQSHLTREARRLAGATPAQVLRDAAVDCAGVHDHAASHGAALAA